MKISKKCAVCGTPKSFDGDDALSQCKQCSMAVYCAEKHRYFDCKRQKALCKTLKSDPGKTTTTSTVTVEKSADKFTNSVVCSTAACAKCLGDKFIKTNNTGNQILEKSVNKSATVSRKRLLQMNYENSHLIDHFANPIFTLSLQDHLKVLEANGIAIHPQHTVALHLKCVADHVIKCLNEYGWAIVDNFLGQNHCYRIHREMSHLYNSGLFKPGQLMETKVDSNSQNIRSDEVYWFDNNDERASTMVTVRLLLSMIDSVIVHFNGRVPYEINGRSRAMLAIYPSNGTHYVKHIDNPMKDGRCITAVYYCNQNWNVETDGGCFRLFSETSSIPLDIEPRADRLLLLWSDRRNPHEVRPVYRDRYAVTVWYFDAHEKRAAVARKHRRDARDKKVENQKQSILFSNEQKLHQPQLSFPNNFTKQELDTLSSHDNLSNHFDIFHPTVSSAQQSVGTTFETEQIMKHGNVIHSQCMQGLESYL